MGVAWSMEYGAIRADSMKYVIQTTDINKRWASEHVAPISDSQGMKWISNLVIFP